MGKHLHVLFHAYMAISVTSENEQVLHPFKAQYSGYARLTSADKNTNSFTNFVSLEHLYEYL